MGDEGFDGHAIVAETYRQLAQEMHVKAGVLASQARAFSDAAQRIEDGAQPSPLRMVDGADGDAAQGRDIVEAEEEERLLRAAVEASRRPPAELEVAMLDALADEAGVEADRAAELFGRWNHELVQWFRAGDTVIILPLPPAFERLGLLAPQRDDARGTLVGHFAGVER